jgi:acetyl-CoA acetyltransferase
MRDVFVAGVGMTRFGRSSDQTGAELGAQAARIAVADAGLDWRRVQYIVGGHVDSGLNATMEMAHQLEWNGAPALTVSNASATGSTAVSVAFDAVTSGKVDIAAAVGFERMITGNFATLLANQQGLSLGSVSGFTPLTFFGMLRARRMHEYGDDDETIARVAVKNYGNGALNPLAQRQRQITVDDVLASPFVAKPMRRLECCAPGDGAAAVILVSKEAAVDHARLVRVAASVTVTDRFHSLGSFGADVNTTALAAREAYERAALGPEDLDVVEVHDAFAVEELIYCEQLGLCPTGEAGALVRSGATAIGGKVAVSPSGGLIARGHPGGPTGTAQIVEVVQQLRGEAGARQQPQARVGLAHMLGGLGVWVVHILTV